MRVINHEPRCLLEPLVRAVEPLNHIEYTYIPMTFLLVTRCYQIGSETKLLQGQGGFGVDLEDFLSEPCTRTEGDGEVPTMVDLYCGNE